MEGAWGIAIFTVVASAVIALVGGLMTRVLLSLDRNQKDLAESMKNLWEHHDGLSKDFYQMKGAHEVNHPFRRITDPKDCQHKKELE